MKKGLVVIVLAAIFSMAGTAMADSQTIFTQGSFTATLTMGSGTATLSFGGLDSYYTDQVAVHISNNATNITGSSTGAGNWTFKSGLNSVNCSTTGNWLCAQASSVTSFNGLTLTWNFTGATIDPVSVQFAVCTAGSSCAPGTTNFVTNFSQSSPVPEPASMGLLAAGLLGVGQLIRRRK